MKNKIIGIIGCLIILLSIFAFVVYNNEFKNNSQIFGEEVIVAKDTISEGDTINEDNTVVKKVTQNQIVSDAITKEDFNKINGKVAAIKINKNEQILDSRLLEKDEYYPETSKIVALKVGLQGALSGSLAPGDRVEIWENDTINKTSEMKASNIKILAIRDTQNQDVSKSSSIPASVVIQVENNEELEAIKLIPPDYLFLTKDTNQLKDKVSKN